MTAEILETRGIVKRFGGLIALDNVSINVKRNSLTLLIGPNGAGKTTLINVCTGVLKPDSGEVLFNPTGNGVINITGWPSHKIFSMGFVRTFQIPLPFLSLTVLENVLVAMKGKGEGFADAVLRYRWTGEEEDRVRRAFQILRLVGLRDYWDMPAYKLGAGQLKMVEVARALAAGAKLIALDEPIGGTDPAYSIRIFETLRSLRERADVTFLIVEHRVDIALRYSDYVYAMDRGRVIAEGKPEEVANDRKVLEVYFGS